MQSWSKIREICQSQAGNSLGGDNVVEVPRTVGADLGDFGHVMAFLFNHRSTLRGAICSMR